MNYFQTAAAHVEMLCDRGRTHAYRRAIERTVPGKVVADIGAGSGILTMFAVRAGAKRVYAVERTPIIRLARDIARANGLADRITFIERDVRDAKVPELVDVVVAELLGNDPLAEGGLTGHAAAARLLKPDGASIPETLSLFAIGIDSGTIRRRFARVENEITVAETLGREYEFDLSPLVRAFAEEARGVVATSNVFVDLGIRASDDQAPNIALTNAEQVERFDLAETKERPPSWRQNVQLQTIGAGRMNAVAIFWEAALDAETTLSTSAERISEVPGWTGQMLTPVDERAVDAGQLVELEARLEPARLPTIRCRWS